MQKNLIIMCITVIGLLGIYYLAFSVNNMHITAVFDDLEPFSKQLDVYYKGYKLGHTGKMYPSKDFSHTNLEMIIQRRNIELPNNIKAKIRTKDKKDYVEIIYPAAPSITYLKNDSIIQGEKGVNISSYLEKQAENGGFDEIKENLNSTIESAGHTFDALTELTNTANLILQEVQPSLTESSRNLAISTKNLANITEELNNSMQPHKMDNTLTNIEESTKNIKLASLNIANITAHANSQTISLIDCVIKNINTVIININDIVKGFKTSLSKNFGGLRLVFGKPLK